MRNWLRELDRDDLTFVGFWGWLGVLWALLAGVVSMVGDLDQSWFDPGRVAPLALLPRVALFWPVWTRVQVESAFVAIGVQPGGLALVLLLALNGALPVALAGAAWVGPNRRTLSTMD